MIWLARETIRYICSPDALEEAQSRRDMKTAGKVIAERQKQVHSALRASRSVPTQPEAHACSRPVSA